MTGVRPPLIGRQTSTVLLGPLIGRHPARTVDRHMRLCDRCGCHNERELGREHLQSGGFRLLRCPNHRAAFESVWTARGSSPTPSLPHSRKETEGATMAWPACAPECSTSAPGSQRAPVAAAQLRAGMETAEASWPGIYCRLRRRGLQNWPQPACNQGFQRMLVSNPRGPVGVAAGGVAAAEPPCSEPGLARAAAADTTSPSRPSVGQGDSRGCHQALLPSTCGLVFARTTYPCDCFLHTTARMMERVAQRRQALGRAGNSHTLQRHGLCIRVQSDRLPGQGAPIMASSIP